MQKELTSMWQDHERHMSTYEEFQTKTLGKDHIHYYDASERLPHAKHPLCFWILIRAGILGTKCGMKFLDQRATK